MELAHKRTNTIINNLNPSIGNDFMEFIDNSISCGLKARRIR